MPAQTDPHPLSSIERLAHTLLAACGLSLAAALSLGVFHSSIWFVLFVVLAVQWRKLPPAILLGRPWRAVLARSLRAVDPPFALAMLGSLLCAAVAWGNASSPANLGIAGGLGVLLGLASTLRLLALGSRAYRQGSQPQRRHARARRFVSFGYLAGLVPFVVLTATALLPPELVRPAWTALAPLVQLVLVAGMLVAGVSGVNALVAATSLQVLQGWSWLGAQQSEPDGTARVLIPSEPRTLGSLLAALDATAHARGLDVTRTPSAWAASGDVDGLPVQLTLAGDAPPPRLPVWVGLTGLPPALRVEARSARPEVPGIGDVVLDTLLAISACPSDRLQARFDGIHQPLLAVMGTFPESRIADGALEVVVELHQTQTEAGRPDTVLGDALALARALVERGGHTEPVRTVHRGRVVEPAR